MYSSLCSVISNQGYGCLVKSLKYAPIVKGVYCVLNGRFSVARNFTFVPSYFQINSCVSAGTLQFFLFNFQRIVCFFTMAKVQEGTRRIFITFDGKSISKWIGNLNTLFCAMELMFIMTIWKTITRKFLNLGRPLCIAKFERTIRYDWVK